MNLYLKFPDYFPTELKIIENNNKVQIVQNVGFNRLAKNCEDIQRG
jgi:hypothetical protein